MSALAAGFVAGSVRMLIDCPHCRSRVLPMADERCPSCMRDTRAPKADPYSVLRIAVGDELPGLCVLCGHDAKHDVSLVERQTLGGESFFLKAILLLASPIRFFRAGPEVHGKRYELAMTVPICSACLESGARPRPKHVNFEQRIVTLLVHDKFAAAFRGEEPPEEDVADPTYREPPLGTSGRSGADS